MEMVISSKTPTIMGIPIIIKIITISATTTIIITKHYFKIAKARICLTKGATLTIITNKAIQTIITLLSTITSNKGNITMEIFSKIIMAEITIIIYFKIVTIVTTRIITTKLTLIIHKDLL